MFFGTIIRARNISPRPEGTGEAMIPSDPAPSGQEMNHDGSGEGFALTLRYRTPLGSWRGNGAVESPDPLALANDDHLQSG